MSLNDISVRDLLARFSSSDPTPGGGSAAALASAVGASLLMMVAALPKTRSGSDEDRTALVDAAAALAPIRERLTAAIDHDTAAYDAVVAAYRMPKGTADEQSARKAAIQHALQEATEVPLGVMRASADALHHARGIAAHGNRSASSDVGVAIALLRAGACGARLNVDVNVGSVTNAAYAERVRAEAGDAWAAATAAATEADRLLPVE
jgi:methenyltetrahydrofolate cyclohydrolase